MNSYSLSFLLELCHRGCDQLLEKKKLDFGCALWGDEEVDYSSGNKYDLSLFFEYLICYKGVTRFYFTNFGRFNKFCWEILTDLKVGYTHIKRIWVVRHYGINVFTDDFPEGYGYADFDDKQHIKVENPKTSMEENINVCKSIIELSLFNIFCFRRNNPFKSNKLKLNMIAYKLCANLSNKKAVYNVYVPRELRKYQPV